MSAIKIELRDYLETLRGIVPDDLKDSCGREHRPNPGRFSEVYSLGRGRH